MAYQALNIIGSFNAGALAAQRDAQLERDRPVASRAVFRHELQLKGRDPVVDISEVSAGDRMVVSDSPQQGRNPYLFMRYPRPEQDADAAPSETPPNDGEPGGSLNVVV